MPVFSTSSMKCEPEAWGLEMTSGSLSWTWKSSTVSFLAWTMLLALFQSVKYWVLDHDRLPESCSLARVEFVGGLVLRRTRLGWWLRRQWIECQEDCRLRSASDRLSSASESSSYDWRPPPGSHRADCRTTAAPTSHHRPRYMRPNEAKDEAEIQTEVKRPRPRMRPTMRPT